MEKSLVSIVTPCYNTGGYIHRLLDSVLQQTYPRIEMFAINDGSTDNSEMVVNSYIPKFEQRGYSLTLVSQKNSGQSVAIREGLKLISGKYLVWPDSDDYYASPLAIEKMVSAFEKLGGEYGMVRTQENRLEDESFHIVGCNGANAKTDYDKGELFEDCLFGQNGYYFCPGAYMADVEKLRKSTTLDIYTDKNAGQNWQLMLPLLYNYKCYTILEPLYNMVIRLSSHSRGQYKGFKRELDKRESYERTILETLKRINGMPQEVKIKYSTDIIQKYCRERISLSFENCRKKDFNRYYSEGVSLRCIKANDRVMRLFFYFPLIVKGIFYIKYHCKHINTK